MEDIKFEKVPSGIFDKVKSNKEQFVEKFIDDLEELFPDTVKDGKVDFQALLERFGEYQDRDEKYELTWVGKNKARQEAFEDIVGRTLKYVEEDSKNPETTENLYIEGDNLEVLKLLKNSYYGKIKMIYIDPPYNTGNDFIYKDDFAISKEEYEALKGDIDEHGNRLVKNNESSGRYHSNWLNMIYPRLQVAKDLLTDDGVIFISIDDNEVHNMRKICDEIFGEENFVAELPTVMNLKGNNDQFGFAGTHEYTLVYLKQKVKVKELNGLPITEEERKQYSLKDKFGFYKQGATLMRTGEAGAREKRPKGFYPIYVNKECTKLSVYRMSDEDYKVYPLTKDGKEMSWRRSKETLMKTKEEFIIKNNNGSISFYKKQRLQDVIKKGKKPKTLFYKPEYSSGNGTALIKELFFNRIYSNPKPLELIKDIVHIGSNSRDIILDFFSGSATTAHAVMDLNAEDGGNRKFIMVQLPEPTDKESVARKEGYENICEIGKERIRRAGDKILEENKDKEGIENLDVGFKVFRVDDTNFRRIKEVEAEDLETRYKSLTPKEERDFNPHFTDIDVVYELMLRRQDIKLTEEVKKLDYIGDRTYIVGNTMLVCLEEEISEDTIEKIGTIDADLSWIVLRDSAFDDNCELKINTANKLRSIIKSSRNKNQKIYWI